MDFYLSLLVILGITLAGGLLPLSAKKTDKFIPLAVFFAAGILIGTSLFHLLPESIEILGAKTGWPILLGFAIFYIPQKFMLTHPCEEGDCDFHQLGMMAFFGIAFHAFTDGIGIGAIAEKPDLYMVATAVTAHKVPAALALTLMLLGAGFHKRKVAVFAVLFSLATPIGAVSTKLLLGGADERWLGIAIGFSVGSFIAIGSSDLLRRLHRHHEDDRILKLALIFIGCTISALG